jgi:uncharacterized protein
MKVVLDTNVVVSGFLSPYGPPAQLLYRVAQGDLQLLYDARILQEYEDVLLRPEFALDEHAVREFLRRVQAEGQLVIPIPLSLRLPEPDDEAFLEVALAGHAEALVTGNRKHFPKGAARGIPILAPAEGLNRLR